MHMLIYDVLYATTRDHYWMNHDSHVEPSRDMFSIARESRDTYYVVLIHYVSLDRT